MFFNRRSCVDEPFTDRVNRVIIDTMAAKGKIIGIDPIPHISVRHFIAPRGLDLSHYNYRQSKFDCVCDLQQYPQWRSSRKKECH